MEALKFLDASDRGPYSGFPWPLPGNGKPGAWVSVKGPLTVCAHGIHAVRLDKALEFLNSHAYVIELGGQILEHLDKIIARKGRLLRRIDGWNEQTQRLFASDCAEHVLHLFERSRPGDDRPRLAIEAARAYVAGEIDAGTLDAAGAAARAAEDEAAGAAAWDAHMAAAASMAAAWAAGPTGARDAAWNSGWAAVGAATWAGAATAAREAAGRAAGRAAEIMWQTQRLAHYFGDDPVSTRSELLDE